MKPREIEVHIEELVLDGFDPRLRWSIADALGSELHALLAQGGVPPAWFCSPGSINSGTVPATRLTNPTTAGGEVAKAVHNGRGK